MRKNRLKLFQSTVKITILVLTHQIFAGLMKMAFLTLASTMDLTCTCHNGAYGRLPHS